MKDVATKSEGCVSDNTVNVMCFLINGTDPVQTAPTTHQSGECSVLVLHKRMQLRK